MTDEQIRAAIVSGWLFFGINSRGEIMARYVPRGPVFHWQGNRMLPMPVQGGDLLWWLQAADEEDDPW